MRAASLFALAATALAGEECCSRLEETVREQAERRHGERVDDLGGALEERCRRRHLRRAP